VSAGQIWRRSDGLLWVEIQTDAVEPSGWRLMIPIVDADQADPAPPLVVTVQRWLARVHLAAGVPDDVLGEPIGRFTSTQVDSLRDALAALIARPS
jgi:hypothetical protein